MRILVVEDDQLLNKTLSYNLSAVGYSVDGAMSKAVAIRFLEKQDYDLIVLDVNLPDGNGFDICHEVKERRPDTAVIFLTANDMESDMLKGFELGADDYVTKPFGMMELISRIKAVLRRTQKDAQDPQDVIVLGDIEMNTKKHEVTADGEVVTLTLKEYELLKRLMKNPNIVMTRDCLLEDIWGYDFDGETRTVDVHVRTLRQKLGKSGEKIETVRGVGYRMSE